MPKVYEGLFDYDNDGKMIPILAESYEMSGDGKTVTFNLRKGVKWHDGKPFTSADVQFTVMDVLKKCTHVGPTPSVKSLQLKHPMPTLQFSN